jgi:hypothetical protein
MLVKIAYGYQQELPKISNCGPAPLEFREFRHAMAVTVDCEYIDLNNAYVWHMPIAAARSYANVVHDHLCK